MQKIVPNLWFDRNAAEAAAFYTAAFEGATAEVTGRYPETGLADFQKDFAGAELTIDLVVEGYRFVLVNAGSEIAPTPAISFLLNFDPIAFGGDEDAARERLDAVWRAVADGGTVRMDLGPYPHSARYGWVEDRYGINWQLMLTDPAGEPRPFVIPTILFSDRAQPRAREAVEFFTSLFGSSRIGTVMPYPGQAEPEHAPVMFADFQLEGQWFAAMDSMIEHAFAFSPGISFAVRCVDQAEIDHLWEALSAVPEAEQCGWLVDRFGISWQIVPADMGELMQRPGSFSRLMTMKKIVIADF